MGHYLLIVGCATRLVSWPRIPAIACGGGVLRGYLAEAGTEEYIRLDISGVEITQATEKGFPNTRFYVSNFLSPANHGFFDVVIFNERIYYALDSLEVFDTFGKMVKLGRAIIVSMHETGVRTVTIWQRLGRIHLSWYATCPIDERKQARDARAITPVDVPQSLTLRDWPDCSTQKI